MAMRKLIIPIQFIAVILCLAFNGYAEEHGERIKNSAGMEFVLIQPGQFMMGSPEDEPGRYTGENPHTVNLTDPFYMQTTEVTQEQWMSLIKKNPSSQKGCGDNCPVEQVSWDDVQNFIQKLNQKEGTDKYRLPTEAEWEYACRAGSTTAFPNGNIAELQCDRDPNLAASFICEIVAGGILAVPSGQREAATASGLSAFQQLRYIILPQAMRTILPPLVGQYVLLVKDSSVVSAIGVVDITRVGWLTVQRIPEGLMVFGLVGLLYFVICYPLINLSNFLERRMTVVSTRL
jgi:hypothetical protein